MNTQRKYTMQLVVVVQPPAGKSSFIATKEIKRSCIHIFKSYEALALEKTLRLKICYKYIDLKTI